MDLNMNLWILYANCDDNDSFEQNDQIYSGFTDDKIMQPKNIFEEFDMRIFNIPMPQCSKNKNKIVQCNNKFLHEDLKG